MININKWRLVYFIFGFLSLLVAAYYEFIWFVEFPLTIFCAALFILLNFLFRKLEENSIMKLYSIYIQNLDPLAYLEAYEDYCKNRFRTKSAKTLDKINSAILLIDAGKTEEAHKILLELTEEEENLGGYLRFWFYNAWIHYFDEVDDLRRMKVLLQQSKELIPHFPPKYRQKMFANYEMVQMKMFVKAGQQLDAAEFYFTKLLRGHYPKITVLTCIYQLGLIAFKKGEYELSQKRLTAVAENGRNLNLVRKARIYLERIEPLNEETL